MCVCGSRRITLMTFVPMHSTHTGGVTRNLKDVLFVTSVRHETKDERPLNSSND
jgi:hypothetical protein